ncbi:MAG: class II fructose-bisphosphate aldolase [Comamonadaceae bacterium]|nr:class II fructose-bisphosphate aldolase [Comamonadaceae bacterium]
MSTQRQHGAVPQRASAADCPTTADRDARAGRGRATAARPRRACKRGDLIVHHRAASRWASPAAPTPLKIVRVGEHLPDRALGTAGQADLGFCVSPEDHDGTGIDASSCCDHAAENGYGVPAFNVNNLEQVQAVMAAAAEVGAPVILQASAGARKYAGETFIKHLIQAAVESLPARSRWSMHQDHGQSPAVCEGAIDLGFSLGDDGRLAAGGRQDHRRATTTTSTSRARWSTWRTRSASRVEGELGCLGSLETMTRRQGRRPRRRRQR